MYANSTFQQLKQQERLQKRCNKQITYNYCKRGNSNNLLNSTLYFPFAQAGLEAIFEIALGASRTDGKYGPSELTINRR